MTTSSAIAGIGAEIQRGDSTSSETFTALAEVSNISGPNISRDTIDVTTLGSTSGYREFIGGFRDGGEVVLDMNWTLAGFNLLKIDFDANTTRNYRILMPNTAASTFTFACVVTNITKNIPTDDKITMTATLKIDGAITLAS
jgi:predicted secreted protein